ncbi:MAG TPA: NAD(P)H-binding protein [Acidimicrobiia bacterium]|nr:NAD(P)H-binding protein [Acidimicrobiia bacterium]
MRVLVTGGNGGLGHRVVLRLDKAGHDVLVGTRTPRAANHFHHDLDDGRAPALDGIDVVVHLATSPLVPSRDIEGSATLWEAAKEAGVGHVIYVSIVGIDDHPSAYYRAKRAVEAQLEASGLPYTILRATQFHSLIPHFHGLVTNWRGVPAHRPRRGGRPGRGTGRRRSRRTS